MKSTFLAVFLWLSPQLFALSMGDSVDQVISERGKPSSRVVAGSIEILNYPDVSIKFRDGAVVDIKSHLDSPNYATHAVAQPAPSRIARTVAETVDSSWTTD